MVSPSLVVLDPADSSSIDRLSTALVKHQGNPRTCLHDGKIRCNDESPLPHSDDLAASGCDRRSALSPRALSCSSVDSHPRSGTCKEERRATFHHRWNPNVTAAALESKSEPGGCSRCLAPNPTAPRSVSLFSTLAPVVVEMNQGGRT